MKHFVLLYDHLTHEVQLDEFTDQGAALDALRTAELALKPHKEVVLFLAESERALKITHSSYFSNGRGNGATQDAPVDLESLTRLVERAESDLQSAHDALAAR